MKRLPVFMIAGLVAVAALGQRPDSAWVSYSNDQLGLFAFYGPQRVMAIDPADFGLSYPFAVESLRARFYGGMGSWEDSVFTFVVYAGDAQTLLYESESLIAPRSLWSYHGLAEPLVIDSGSLYIGLSLRTYQAPFAYPYMTTDDNSGPTHCFYGSPGAWTVWPDGWGEYFLAAFVREPPVGTGSWQERAWNRVVIAPNPLSTGSAVLEYRLASPAPVRVLVFDACGNRVLEQAGPRAKGNRLVLETGRLGNGIYIVRFEAGDYRTTRKLVVQR